MGKKSSSPMCSPSDGDWRAESDHNTLTRAAEVKNDPARMKGVMRHQQKAASNLQTVHNDIADAGIRKTKGYKGVMKTLKGLK